MLCLLRSVRVFFTNERHAHLIFSINYYLTVVEKLCVSVTCKAVLAKDFNSSVRNVNAKESCRERPDKI